MRADKSKAKAFTVEIGRLRIISDQQRKEHTKIISWVDSHYLPDGRVVNALAMVLPTRACKYARAKHGGCSFCTLPSDNPYNPSEEDLKLIPENALHIFQEKQNKVDNLKVVKFYTSGSFLDPWELPYDIRDELLTLFSDKVEEMVIETRCEYVIRKHLDGITELISPSKLIVAIGQETTNDEINKRANNKGHTLKQFKRAVSLLKEYGFRSKGYILLKPIFTSEYLAKKDAILSGKDMMEAGVNGISINPCYIGKGTLMDKLFKKGNYSSPWLWTVLDVTKAIKEMVGSDIIVISDPVAAGKDRGPRNCGSCDAELKTVLKEFSATQNLNLLQVVTCSCRQIYDNSLLVESLGNGHGIFGYANH